VAFADGKAREINVKTEKVGEAVHWMPEKIEVKPGEKIHFKIEHKLDGGFNFHGFSINALKIVQTVNRNTPTEVDVTIPADMKPGEYDITCQYHPKHVSAKLIGKK
jgi:plastocyanin